MTRIELIAFDGLARGWLLLLAFTSALLVTGLLRKSFRQIFGAERAFQLWLLLPLAMLASQLPHASGTASARSSTVITILTKVAHIPALPNHANSVGWYTAAAIIWLVGMALVLCTAMHAQSRYRSRLLGAISVDHMPFRWPVLRARYTDVGPALVGAWRARVVLPSDFDDRYDVNERALILAHEVMHARRGDGWWCLLAQIIVAIFWFHPLAWRGLRALRHDQELACDAAVIREHGKQRRCYANAILKTQAATRTLPVGCLWSPRHPLTERIAMLKFSCPSKARQLSGALFLAFAFVCAGSSVYAASNPDNAVKSNPTALYQLAVQVSRNGETLATPIVCVKAGEPAGIRGLGADGKLAWQFDLIVKPLSAVNVEIGVTSFKGKADERGLAFHPVMKVPFDQPTVIKKGDEENGLPLELAITPSRDCPVSKVAMRMP